MLTTNQLSANQYFFCFDFLKKKSYRIQGRRLFTETLMSILIPVSINFQNAIAIYDKQHCIVIYNCDRLVMF